MFPLSFSNLIPPAVSFALALLFTPLGRMLGRRWGFVAKPKTDRWHKNPTAMMGGVAIWRAAAGSFLVLRPPTPAHWGVRGAGSFLVRVGFRDDSRHLQPYLK